MIQLIALVFALVFFVLGAFNLPTRWNLVSAGLACYMISILVSGHFLR